MRTSSSRLLSRPSLPALAALALIGCGHGPAAPSVLLITLDTTRADALACYGGETPTPGLDAVAARGARFQLALASAALTPPSHATILTGREPYEHGVRVLLAAGGVRLRPDVPTLAELLASQGYETATFQSAFPVSGFYGLDRGFAVVDSVGATVGRLPDGSGATWDSRRGQRRADATTDRALVWLETAAPPFFLWLHYWDPHDPMVVPPTDELPAGLLRDAAGRPRKSVELYAAEVAYVDRQVGRVLAALEQRGLTRSTLVAVTADHGEGLEDGRVRHGWWGHRILYQEQLQVPLLLSGPGVPAGVTVSALARTVDLAPTLLDYAGVQAPPLTGRSLRPLLEGRPDAARIAYADALNRFDENAAELRARRARDELVYAVSDGRWKLLFRPAQPGESELFDLLLDPAERHDLLRVEHGEVARLLGDLAARAPWVLEPFEGPGGAADSDAADVLADLGYVGPDADTPMETTHWEWICPEHGLGIFDGRTGLPAGHGSCSLPGVPVSR